MTCEEARRDRSSDLGNAPWHQDDDCDDIGDHQGCILCLTCSHRELTKDHVLTSAYVKFFRIVTRNAVNKSF